MTRSSSAAATRLWVFVIAILVILGVSFLSRDVAAQKNQYISKKNQKSVLVVLEKKNRHKFRKNIKKNNNEVTPEVINLTDDSVIDLTDDSDHEQVPPPEAARARAPSPENDSNQDVNQDHEQVPVPEVIDLSDDSDHEQVLSEAARVRINVRRQQNYMNRQAARARARAPSPENDSNQDVNQDNEQVPPEAVGARAPPKEVSFPNQRNRPIMLSYKGPHRHRRNFNDVNQDHDQVSPEPVQAKRRFARGPLKRYPRGHLLHRSLPEPPLPEPPLPGPPLPANKYHIQQLPKYRISENDTLPEHAGQCAICLEEFSPGDMRMMLHCFHAFHTNCCTEWLRINGSCPICKTRIEENF